MTCETPEEVKPRTELTRAQYNNIMNLLLAQTTGSEVSDAVALTDAEAFAVARQDPSDMRLSIRRLLGHPEPGMFREFARLPEKIQKLIWEMAADSTHGRVIGVSGVHRRDRGPKMSALLNACKMSRRAVLERIVLITVQDMRPPAPPYSAWFNPEKDVVLLKDVSDTVANEMSVHDVVSTITMSPTSENDMQRRLPLVAYSQALMRELSRLDLAPLGVIEVPLNSDRAGFEKEFFGYNSVITIDFRDAQKMDRAVALLHVPEVADSVSNMRACLYDGRWAGWVAQLEHCWLRERYHVENGYGPLHHPADGEMITWNREDAWVQQKLAEMPELRPVLVLGMHKMPRPVWM